MAIQTSGNLSSLDFNEWSSPFVNIESTNLNTNSLNFVEWSSPFVGAANSGATSPQVLSNTWVNVNGTWKRAANVYVNVNGTWKTVSNKKISVNVNQIWKS